MEFNCSVHECWASGEATGQRLSWCGQQAEHGRTLVRREAPALAARGALARAAIKEVMQEHGPAVRACFECVLDRAADPRRRRDRRLVLRFMIDARGQVARATVVAPTREPSLDDCVLGVLSHAQFPRPNGGAVEVDYPYVFQPEG